MNYKEKLLDPRWQKKRLEVFQRDGFKCTLCQDEKSTLHVHHLYYRKSKDIWDYPMEAFETYCEHCHTAVEYLKKEQPDLIPYVVRKIWYDMDDKLSLLLSVKEVSTDKIGIVTLIFYNGKISHGTYLSEVVMDSIIEMYKTPITDGK